MGLGDAISKVRKIRAENENLLPLLMEQLHSRRETRLKKDMWFSPSQIAGMCPRTYAIAWKLGMPVVSEADPNARWRMDFGTVIHSLMQDVWGGSGGWLLGGWKCSNCGQKYGIDPDDKIPALSHGKEERAKVTPQSAIRMPEQCETCGMKPSWREGFQFIEPLLYNNALKVCGWADGILELPGQPREIVDFKTTAAIRWVREKPSKSHIIQLQWYMDMAKIPSGRIVYVDRTAKELEDAIVEHKISRDYRMMEDEKQKVRSLRKVFEEPKEERSISTCPDGGKGPFGPCSCTELEDIWEAHGG